MKTLTKQLVIGAVLSAFVGVSHAATDPIFGVWQTEPDRKDLISHIDVRPCGAKICGTVLRAFDRQGRQVQTKNVGRRLFWDMQSRQDGTYEGGTFDIPFLNVKVKARMALGGRPSDGERMQGRDLRWAGLDARFPVNSIFYENLSVWVLA